ncbi:MAG TPA: hypothetical protein VK674_02045 [Candidatus Limnocylindria bacterium]|nr:hypothetical protein [Candidatus Limnocylindria bacterium]
MNKLHKNELGFGAAGLLLILIVVGLVGTTGWLVYNNNRKETPAPAVTPPVTESPTETPPVAQANVTKIPELGIEFTVPDQLKEMAYKATTTDYGPGHLSDNPMVYLSTKALNSAEGGKCDISAASGEKGSVPPLGFLSKTMGQYPAAPTADNSSGDLVKQFPTYYIAYRSAGMSCFSEAATIEKVAGLNSQLGAALKSIIEVK